MAIDETVTLLAHNMFVQRDARDPLGIWNSRTVVAGDASGNPIRVTITAAQISHVYILMGITISFDSSSAGQVIKYRLLTNRPPANPTGGLAAFAYNRTGITTNTTFNPPSDNIFDTNVDVQTSRILMFGSDGQSAVPQPIMELASGGNNPGTGITFFFEAYGYFYDLDGVLNAPGGPRYPMN